MITSLCPEAGNGGPVRIFSSVFALDDAAAAAATEFTLWVGD